jgi:penicillin-binding protein 1A
MTIAVALIGVFIYLYTSTPIPTAASLANTTYVYDHHGKLLTTLHAAVNRTEIPIAQMPLQMRQAVISVEDKNFYHEGGVSFVGIARAAWANLRHREVTQGGSTITQQYVKLVYTGDQRTISRKVTEAIIAMKIDKKYTKDQILEAYLNTVYFGQGAYGVQAAAETYFGVGVQQLDTGQAALLAGMIRAPG